MCGGKLLRLVVCALVYASVLGQQAGPTQQQQPQRANRLLEQQQGFNTLSQRQGVQAPRANLLLEQQQGFNTLGQRQGVQATRFTPQQPQGPRIPINEDIRDGPFHDGSYYFGYVSGDGSVREEGAVPTADGSFIVTGSYTYTAPNGEVISMEYIADANGYRAFPKGSRADFTSPQRILNAPPLPNTPFVNQPQGGFRPVNNNLRPLGNTFNNQVNRPNPQQLLGANRPNPQQFLGANRPNPQQLLGANRLVGNPQNTAAASNNINIIAEPIEENNI